MVKDYTCVDLETTGCRSKWDKIIEIGAVKVRDGKVIDTFSEFVDPGVRIPLFITSLTGINDKMVKGKKTVETALGQFIDFAGEDILMGHNLRFDYSFLKQNAVNCGLSFERSGIDTLKIARKVHSELPSRSLCAMCGFYGINEEHHHRAYDDADAASRLYLKMGERFFDDFPEIFAPVQMQFSVKQLQPATPRQVRYLKDLYRYHRIEEDCDFEALSKSEASRRIDEILRDRGRVVKK